MARRRRKSRRSPWGRWALLAVGALPALYLLAALVGSLVPVNRGWTEPAEGVTVYIAENGIHADIIMPAVAQGLDWRPLVPRSHTATAHPEARWAFARANSASISNSALAGHQAQDHRSGVWAAARDARRMGPRPSYAARRSAAPRGYRRLLAPSAAISPRCGGRPRTSPPRLCCCDTFYRATGKRAPSAPATAGRDRLRLAGIKTSLWPPFVQGLTWRYRASERVPEA